MFFNEILSKYQVLIHVLLISSCLKSTKTSGLGKCPRNLSMPDFNLTRFAGQWFEVERSFYLMEIASSCTSLNFTMNSKGNMDVDAMTVNRWTESTTVKSGVAIPITNGSSVLRFKFKTQLPFHLARLLPGAGIYHILHTNFDNFAILWTCTNFALINIDRFWILGRTRDIPASMRIDIYDKIRTFNLDPERLILSKNENCENYTIE